jgi:arylsulfatase A-like enzyme
VRLVLCAMLPVGARAAEDSLAAANALPNVVLITIDTLRADHCGIYGYDRPTTPHLDALASQGAVFEAAYAVSATTLPSTATLFTSLHPNEHGVLKNGRILPERVRTMAEILGSHGYDTAAFVSSFVVERRFGTAQGFDAYDDDFTGASSSSPIRHWEGHQLSAPYDRRGHETALRAIRWLHARQSQAPFFLWVHLFDPHSPYDPPEPYREQFARAGATSEKERWVDLYDAEVRFGDEQLGRLLAAVDALAPVEPPLTIVAGDHGEGLLDHEWLEHGVHLYEEAVRVPLIVRWPGRIAPQRNADPVGLVDVLPTLLSLLELPKPDGMRGADLARVLQGQTRADPERAVFMQRRLYRGAKHKGVRVAGPKWAIRWRNWKFIYASLDDDVELYDLETDPQEKRDRAPEHPELVQGFKGRLDSWLAGQPVPAKPRSHDLSPRVRQALEALGYVE